MEQNKKKWIIIAVACVVLAAIVYFVGTNVSCNNASNKIEVISEPYLSYRRIGSSYSPTVSVSVKNKTGGDLQIQMTCTVYKKDGSVNTGLKSSIIALVVGETATVTASTSKEYMWFEFDEFCASFDKVEYKFY